MVDAGTLEIGLELSKSSVAQFEKEVKGLGEKLTKNFGLDNIDIRVTPASLKSIDELNTKLSLTLARIKSINETAVSPRTKATPSAPKAAPKATPPKTQQSAVRGFIDKQVSGIKTKAIKQAQLGVQKQVNTQVAKVQKNITDSITKSITEGFKQTAKDQAKNAGSTVTRSATQGIIQGLGFEFGRKINPKFTLGAGRQQLALPAAKTKVTSASSLTSATVEEVRQSFRDITSDTSVTPIRADTKRLKQAIAEGKADIAKALRADILRQIKDAREAVAAQQVQAKKAGREAIGDPTARAVKGRITRIEKEVKGIDVDGIIAANKQAAVNVSASWDKTAKSVKQSVSKIEKDTKKQGKRIQSNIAEASPGTTYRIRKAWAKTAKFVTGQINKISKSSKQAGSKIQKSLAQNPLGKGIKFGKQKGADFFGSLTQGFEKFRQKINKTNNLLGITGKAIKIVTLAAVGFQGLRIIGGIIGSVARKSLGDARTARKIVRNLKAADVTDITNQLEQVKILADEIGTEATQAGLDYSNFARQVRDTPLKSQSGQVFRDLLSGFRGFDLDDAAISRSLTAINQILNKGVVKSEELVGQLSESLPGAITTAAEALDFGRENTAEFLKAVQGGEVTAEQFIPAFSGQLRLDTLRDARLNADTLGASLRRLQNQTDEISAAAGEVVLKELVNVVRPLSFASKAIGDNAPTIIAFTSTLVKLAGIALSGALLKSADSALKLSARLRLLRIQFKRSAAEAKAAGKSMVNFRAGAQIAANGIKAVTAVAAPLVLTLVGIDLALSAFDNGDQELKQISRQMAIFADEAARAKGNIDQLAKSTKTEFEAQPFFEKLVPNLIQPFTDQRLGTRGIDQRVGNGIINVKQRETPFQTLDRLSNLDEFTRQIEDARSLVGDLADDLDRSLQISPSTLKATKDALKAAQEKLKAEEKNLDFVDEFAPRYNEISILIREINGLLRIQAENAKEVDTSLTRVRKTLAESSKILANIDFQAAFNTDQRTLELLQQRASGQITAEQFESAQSRLEDAILETQANRTRGVLEDIQSSLDGLTIKIQEEVVKEIGGQGNNIIAALDGLLATGEISAQTIDEIIGRLGEGEQEVVDALQSAKNFLQLQAQVLKLDISIARNKVSQREREERETKKDSKVKAKERTERQLVQDATRLEDRRRNLIQRREDRAIQFSRQQQDLAREAEDLVFDLNDQTASIAEDLKRTRLRIAALNFENQLLSSLTPGVEGLASQLVDLVKSIIDDALNLENQGLGLEARAREIERTQREARRRLEEVSIKEIRAREDFIKEDGRLREEQARLISEAKNKLDKDSATNNAQRTLEQIAAGNVFTGELDNPLAKAGMETREVFEAPLRNRLVEDIKKTREQLEAGALPTNVNATLGQLASGQFFDPSRFQGSIPGVTPAGLSQRQQTAQQEFFGRRTELTKQLSELNRRLEAVDRLATQSAQGFGQQSPVGNPDLSGVQTIAQLDNALKPFLDAGQAAIDRSTEFLRQQLELEANLFSAEFQNFRIKTASNIQKFARTLKDGAQAIQDGFQDIRDQLSDLSFSARQVKVGEKFINFSDTLAGQFQSITRDNDRTFRGIRRQLLQVQQDAIAGADLTSVADTIKTAFGQLSGILRPEVKSFVEEGLGILANTAAETGKSLVILDEIVTKVVADLDRRRESIETQRKAQAVTAARDQFASQAASLESGFLSSIASNEVNPFKQRSLEAQAAAVQLTEEFRNSNAEIERLKLTAETLKDDTLIGIADRLSQLSLESFQAQLDDINRSSNLIGEIFENNFIRALENAKSVGEFLRNLFRGILQDIQKISVRFLARSLTGGLFGGGLFNFANGGTMPNQVPNFASGRFSAPFSLGLSMMDALMREKQQSGKRGIPAILHAGETVLTEDQTRRFEDAVALQRQSPSFVAFPANMNSVSSGMGRDSRRSSKSYTVNNSYTVYTDSPQEFRDDHDRMLAETQLRTEQNIKRLN